MKVTFIVPALNEEKNIGATIDTLIHTSKKLKMEYEIIIVNDGSTDKTQLIVEQLASHFNHIKLYNFSRNKGIGQAIKKAAEHVTGSHFMIFPGDGNLNAKNLEILLNYTGDFDLILGYFVDDHLRGKLTKFVSRLYSLLWTTIFDVHIQYIHSVGIYSSSILEKLQLRSNGFAVISELNSKAYKMSTNMIEVPIHYEKIIDKGNSHKLKNIIKTFVFLTSNYSRLKKN
jgi:glycosyltransferase involved in cell wall biosynthesis